MSDSKKLYDPREVAQAILNKAKDILQESTLIKSEPLTKYETENRKSPPSVKYGKIEKDVKPIERDWDEYEVKLGNSKDSSGPRLKKQVSPSGNPKEFAEGNNKPDGMEPEYEFKDKVSKELSKEKDSHMVKSQSGMHTVVYRSASFEKSETETADLKKAESKHDRCVKDVERNSPDVKNAHAVCVAEGVKPAKWGKSEANPDEKEDAKLGERVEHDVEEHFKENKDAEEQEGHDLQVKEEKSEMPTEHAIIPRLVGSAKLSKFMEHMHSKRKHKEAQEKEAVGSEASDAPEAGSHQDGRPNLEKKYEGFKAVEESAKESGASDPAAVAAAAGRKKYGKEAFQHAAAAGKKMGKK